MEVDEDNMVAVETMPLDLSVKKKRQAEHEPSVSSKRMNTAPPQDDDKGQKYWKPSLLNLSNLQDHSSSVQATDKPTIDKPTTDKPMTDKPITDKPTTDKPAIDKTAIDKPAIDKPAIDKPAIDKPATDKPVTDKPAMQWRPSVVVLSPAAAAPVVVKDDYHVPAVSPLIADHVSPLNHLAAVPDAASYQHNVLAASSSSEYNPFFAAAAAAVAAATNAARPSLPLSMPLPPITTEYHHHHHHHQQQQQQHLQLQRQLQWHEHQLQIQRQLQQQHQFDLLAQKMASPLYATAAMSPSSSESNPFPFGGYDCLQPGAAPYNFGYPYFDGILGIGSGEFGGGGGGSCGRSDCLSPGSTVASSVTDHRASMRLDNPDVNPEEVAAIYRQSDFVSFRNRYLESLGPPKNFEKMRRSIPSKKLLNGQQPFDQTYVMKRQKNNEAAKRSRDAKRQKYIENQISVMYLTKKVSEMKEIKRRLLMSM